MSSKLHSPKSSKPAKLPSTSKFGHNPWNDPSATGTKSAPTSHNPWGDEKAAIGGKSPVGGNYEMVPAGPPAPGSTLVRERARMAGQPLSVPSIPYAKG